MGWIPRCQAGSSSSSRAFQTGVAHNVTESQLEVNIISAQDVKRAMYVGQMHAYAVAWIKEDYKLRTHMVNCHDLHPAWNARLHFSVPEAFFSQEKGTLSALNIELYCQGRVHHSLLGTVRVLLSTLSRKGKGYHGAQTLALQIRRPSGRPQGILNIGSLILDPDSSIVDVPRLLRSPYLFEDDHQKVERFGPLREFQEMCRRSFSVSREDVLGKEKLSKFSMDDTCLHKHADLSSMEAVSEDDDDDEQDLAMEAIYKKLKAVTQCNTAEKGNGGNRGSEHVSTEPVEIKDDAKYKITGNASTNSVEPIKQSNDTEKEVSRKGYNDKMSAPTALEGMKEKGDQVMEKLSNEALCTEFTTLFQDRFVDRNALEKKGSICSDTVIKVNKIGDSVVFFWQDLPLNQKKELFSDEVMGKKGKNSNLRVWANRASCAFRKGAAKIHITPSGK